MAAVICCHLSEQGSGEDLVSCGAPLPRSMGWCPGGKKLNFLSPLGSPPPLPQVWALMIEPPLQAIVFLKIDDISCIRFTRLVAYNEDRSRRAQPEVDSLRWQNLYLTWKYHLLGYLVL